LIINPPCIERRVGDNMKMPKKKIEVVGLSMQVRGLGVRTIGLVK